MLVRGALGRLAVAKSSARTRALHQALVSRNAATLSAVRALSRAHQAAGDAYRSYATTTAATTPTATVKKAVKAKAVTKAAPKKKATTTTARKTSTTAAKAPAKKPATKSVAGRAKARPAAKKAAPKKPAAKKRVKKVLTPEEKSKLKIKELRKIALREPVSPATLSSWVAFVAEKLGGKSGEEGAVSSRIRAVSAEYKALTPAELEHYNHIASERTAAKKAEYRAWVLSHTPAEIHRANNARANLRRLLIDPDAKKIRYPPYTQKIEDDRQPKSFRNAYNQFSTERHISGDMKNIDIIDAAKLIATEWKSLTAAEKKKYEDAAATDMVRYKREAAARDA